MRCGGHPLFSTVKEETSGSHKVGVNLHVDTEKMKQVIEERIYQGVENFFQSLLHAFKGKSVGLPAAFGKDGSEADSGSGFADAAFLVGDGDDAAHAFPRRMSSNTRSASR